MLYYTLFQGIFDVSVDPLEVSYYIDLAKFSTFFGITADHIHPQCLS